VTYHPSDDLNYLMAPAITLGNDVEVRYWTLELGVSEAKLREAIATVGAGEVFVRAYLLGAMSR
jgi:hypothetical protein